MSNDSFLQLRFVGDRFSKQSIPFGILPGIAHFKALIVEASRIEYLKHRRNCKRISSRFSPSIELRLTAIKEGIVQVGISMDESTTMPLSAKQVNYFSRGLDSLVRTIDKAGNGEKIEPPEVTEEMSIHFDVIGKTLEYGEEIHLIRPDSIANECKSSVFTRQISAKLSSTTPTDDVACSDFVVCGHISAFDQENNTLRLQLHDGRRFEAAISSDLLDTALDAFNGYRRGLQARVRGIGLTNSDGEVIEISKITELSINDPLNISHQLDKLRKLSDGWLDGEGMAPSCDGIRWIEATLRRYLPMDFSPVYLYPTETGGILLEWSIESTEASLEVNLESHTGIWHELNMQSGGDLEREMNLDEGENWKYIIQHTGGLG